MSVLDIEDINRKLENFAERIRPKMLLFKEFFKKSIVSCYSLFR